MSNPPMEFLEGRLSCQFGRPGYADGSHDGKKPQQTMGDTDHGQEESYKDSAAHRRQRRSLLRLPSAFCTRLERYANLQKRQGH